MKAWTDYPFTELGDIEYQAAPVREVRIVSYDGNKYCHIEVAGIESSVKIGYLYRKPGRCGEVPKVDKWKLRLPDGTPYWQRNKRRERKTTWILQSWDEQNVPVFRQEVDTLQEATRIFNASPIGTVLSRNIDTPRRGYFSDMWERIEPVRQYGRRVKKRALGRK